MVDEEIQHGFIVYAGASLTNPDVEPIHVLLNRQCYEGINTIDPRVWGCLLFIIEAESGETSSN